MGNRSAFSLIELVTAGLVLGLALLPLYGFVTSSARTALNSKLGYFALHVARETVEELQQIPPERWPESWSRPIERCPWEPIEGGLFRTVAERRGSGQLDEKPVYPREYGRFHRKVHVERDTGVLKLVTVEVSWQHSGESAASGRRGSIRLTTVIGQHAVDPEAVP